MFAHPSIHPTRDQRLVLNDQHFQGALIVVPDRPSKQLEAVTGIIVLMVEIQIRLLRASLGKISHGHVLQFVLMRHTGPSATELLAGSPRSICMLNPAFAKAIRFLRFVLSFPSLVSILLLKRTSRWILAAYSRFYPIHFAPVCLA
jgi:hypothetical protein